VVTRGLKLDEHEIGYDLPATDPETFWDQAGALDGMIDPLSGHGTFIAGLVHQGCPDADIVSWRVVPSMGPIVESDWITALAQIAELNRRGRGDEDGGKVIDVLSLSMGYYHETAYDSLFDPTLYAVLADLASNGTLVVCSAGNDATSRPCFPAAFAPWLDDEDGENGSIVETPPGQLPILSVGALNPNKITDALFSNAGPWVRSYVEGAAVVSTVPPFQGSLQPLARSVAFDRIRENIDPDDFRGGFGVWSGTSFAAPLMAGRLAAYLSARLPAECDVETATSLAMDALEEVAHFRSS
jgi:subtilisin family serine protease